MKRYTTPSEAVYLQSIQSGLDPVPNRASAHGWRFVRSQWPHFSISPDSASSAADGFSISATTESTSRPTLISATPAMKFAQWLTGDEDTLGRALPDGDGHPRRHLAEHCVHNHNADRPDDHVGPPAATTAAFSPVAPSSAPARSIAIVAAAFVPTAVIVTSGKRVRTAA